MRPSGRARDEMRYVILEPDISKYAEGSCLACFGDTQVLCTASVEERVPPFLRNTGAAGSPPNTACCRARPTRAPTARRRAASSPAAPRRSSA